MTYNAKTPEDMVPDDKSYFEMGDKSIRKGTMSAALANAEIIEALDATEAEKLAAMNALRKLVPILKTFGLTKFLTWKNPKIQSIFDEID